MDKINSFTFYRNYYEFYKNLSENDRLMLINAILKYMFENEEQNNLEGIVNAIWINIKMPLETNKNNIINGSKGGAPKGNKNACKKQPKNNPKTTEHTSQKQANNISIFLFLISNFKFINNNINLKNKIEEWLKYKTERKENYKETGLKILLKKIEENAIKYGADEIISLIDDSMSNGYKGIIFDKLKGKKIIEQQPEWFGKEIDDEELLSDEEIAKLEGGIK